MPWMEFCNIIIHSTAWNLDELLFRDYHNVDESKEPIFCIQAPRTGSTSFSTQLYRVVEDEYVIMGGPFVVMPYIWLRRLLSTICWRVTEKDLFDLLVSLTRGTIFSERYPPVYRGADTFESAYMMNGTLYTGFIMGLLHHT
eukprot:UN34275